MSREQTPFSKWYEANKVGFNAERKAKYHSDPAYREAVLDRQRNARRSNPRPSVSTEKLYRDVNGEQVQVFRMGHVSQVINRSEKTIRAWESAGIIPTPTIPGKHRCYTQGQLALLKHFSAVMDQVRYNNSLREIAVQAASANLHNEWES